jgi:hypothetical protein
VETGIKIVIMLVLIALVLSAVGALAAVFATPVSDATTGITYLGHDDNFVTQYPSGHSDSMSPAVALAYIQRMIFPGGSTRVDYQPDPSVPGASSWVLVMIAAVPAAALSWIALTKLLSWIFGS